ncbi:unnamed protein product [Anisakis simplex]|uniref:phosphoenolpyruvate carboxykinase (GTP) n=1 Tax=Anisakis simplex TaxID=6269 RepID=A0A0M3K912_ANISI|nr:unnamed protein product [Anisakis simplex]
MLPSASTLPDTKDGLYVYRMARKKITKKRRIRRRNISQRCLKASDFRLVTEFYINGYGAVPVIAGDPRILPSEAQLFVARKAKLMRPRAICICDGSQEERTNFIENMQRKGFMKQLEALRECYLVMTDPRDAIAQNYQQNIVTPKRERLETRTHDVIPRFAKWMSPVTFNLELVDRFSAAMFGRVMYVIPFSLGPIGSKNSLNCIQITDSEYVAIMTSICARVSSSVWDSMENGNFIGCVHSVGVPRPVNLNNATTNWPFAPYAKFMALDVEKRVIWSVGCGCEDAILCKTEAALRMASLVGKRERWLAERMTVIAITAPDKSEHFIGLAGPDGSGKTTLAFMQPTLPGWQVLSLIISDFWRTIPMSWYHS